MISQLTKDTTEASITDSTAIVILTGRLKRGEEEAFHEFHALYFDRIYHFLLLVTHGQEDQAREALQETLLRVTKYVREFTSEEVFWCWIKAVARSAAQDGGRKRFRYLNLLKNFALRWSGSAVYEEFESKDDLRPLLKESLNEMETPDRQLIEGKYIEGATVKELACSSGLTEKAVESRLLRLRRELREKLLNKLRSP